MNSNSLVCTPDPILWWLVPGLCLGMRREKKIAKMFLAAWCKGWLKEGGKRVVKLITMQAVQDKVLLSLGFDLQLGQAFLYRPPCLILWHGQGNLSINAQCFLWEEEFVLLVGSFMSNLFFASCDKTKSKKIASLFSPFYSSPCFSTIEHYGLFPELNIDVTWCFNHLSAISKKVILSTRGYMITRMGQLQKLLGMRCWSQYILS